MRLASPFWLMILVVGPALTGSLALAENKATPASGETSEEYDDPFYDPFDPPGEKEAMDSRVADPLERINRILFTVNDRLYFWVLKPVATGYQKVVPEVARVSVRRFFSNAETPIRFANCLLQAKFKSAGTEVARFSLNTTIGIGGLLDPALHELKLGRTEEDLGQTLGRYGIGEGLYLNLPVVGPSSIRDTLGMTGDMFLRPWPYVLATLPNMGLTAYRNVNETSLSLGVYEDLKKSAVDPYAAIRNAYVQHRRSVVRDGQ